MKEYKLSTKSKYSVLYLLSGLFMFFFMFAIFSINGHCATGSLSCNPDGYTEQIVGYTRISYNTSWHSMVEPYTSLVSGDIKFSESSSAYFKNASMEAHFVTSCGDYVVLSTDSNNTTSSISSTYHRKLQGYPVAYYFVVRATTNGTAPNINSCYVTLTYNLPSNPSVYDNDGLANTLRSVNSDTSQILALLGGGDSPLTDVFSDYSSYSPLTLMNNVSFRSDYSSEVVSAGSPCLFSFDSLSTSSLNFSPRYLTFNLPSGHSKLLIVFIVDNQSNVVSNDLNFNVYYNGVQTNYSVSDFNVIRSFTDGTNYRWVCSKVFEFDSDIDMNLVYMVLQGTSPSTISSFNFMGYIYKATIADYMQYTKDQWNNVAPTVTNTDINTAQSVSTVGSASTFESAQFDNFDNIVSSSGIDHFSLSFASAPLLWCGSLITTCYNNLPSSIQYLFMAVGFVGILMLILNVFGRVVKRVGGDS